MTRIPVWEASMFICDLGVRKGGAGKWEDYIVGGREASERERESESERERERERERDGE